MLSDKGLERVKTQSECLAMLTSTKEVFSADLNIVSAAPRPTEGRLGSETYSTMFECRWIL